ncbi:MAG TPA: rod shape-determining protein MreC [Bacteroidetes bacterium]|nr:rod shape-determining protein MreC [Bacteroidota bacterium]HRK05941.1 rod shape-determining protein MreC [Chlorobiota bacterium]
MQRFIAFVVRFKNYIALCVLVVMSFSLMSFGDLAQLGGFRAVIVGSIGWMQSLFAWIPNPVALKSENTALRELNLQLSLESSRSRQAMVENTTLRKMLELQPMVEYRLIAADVVGKTTTQMRNYATINKGTADGVKEGMSCVTDAGLVGLIIGASDHYAVVQLLLNRDTRVAAKVQRSRVDGIIGWDGEQTLSLKNVPRSFDVQAGDLVLTSSYSAKYPPNVIIGRVSQVTDENNSLFRKVVVEPAVNFATVEQVFVVEFLPDSERVALERDIEERQRQRARD